MRLETCIRKSLRLKTHRVREVREEDGRLVAELEWTESRPLTCGRCSRKTRQIHSRCRSREWKDLRVRDQELVLTYAPRRHLKQWLWWASHSRLEPFKRFARMIREHLEGIFAWTTLRISNGALEGMNNKIKAVSHRAYGYRRVDTYVTAIWHGCGDLPLP